MNELKSIWPTLGGGYQSFPRNLSWTKSGPGRRHSKLSKKLVTAISEARSKGMKVDPNEILFA